MPPISEKYLAADGRRYTPIRVHLCLSVDDLVLGFFH